MDKKSYLTALSRMLRGKRTQAQIREILQDYEGFFAAGRSEGKSEEEISAEFGPPDQAADRILEEERQRGGGPGKAVGFTVVMLIFGTLCAASFWNLRNPEPQRSIGIAAALALFAQAAVSEWPGAKEKWHRRWAVRAQAVLFALLAAGAAVTVTLVLRLDRGVPSSLIFAAGMCLEAGPALLAGSGMLSFLSAARGCRAARHRLLADTFFFALYLNLWASLSNVSETYDGGVQAMSCFLGAAAANLAAWALFLLLHRLNLRRKQAAV